MKELLLDSIHQIESKDQNCLKRLKLENQPFRQCSHSPAKKYNTNILQKKKESKLDREANLTNESYSKFNGLFEAPQAPIAEEDTEEDFIPEEAPRPILDGEDDEDEDSLDEEEDDDDDEDEDEDDDNEDEDDFDEDEEDSEKEEDQSSSTSSSQIQTAL